MKTDAKTDAQGLVREEAVELLSFFCHRLLPQITRVLFSLGLATSQAIHPRDLRSLRYREFIRNVAFYVSHIFAKKVARQ